MRNIFYDTGLNDTFRENGFVFLPNFLNGTEATHLAGVFNLPAESESTMHLTNLSDDEAYKFRVQNGIIDSIYPKANTYLDHYVPAHGIFSCKPVGERSAMCFHRDWGLVDEEQFVSLSVWVLLTNPGQRNGGLSLLPGSHKDKVLPRGRNFPFELSLPDNFDQLLVSYDMQVGDAVIFDHRTIHGSPVNEGPGMRLAAVLALIPEEAPMLHYYRDPDKRPVEVELLELDRETFYAQNFNENVQRPRHLRVIKKYTLNSVTL